MIQTILLSLLRHSISLFGGAVLVKEHDSEIGQLAGAIAVLVPVIWSAVKSHREKSATASAVEKLNSPYK